MCAVKKSYSIIYRQDGWIVEVYTLTQALMIGLSGVR